MAHSSGLRQAEPTAIRLAASETGTWLAVTIGAVIQRERLSLPQIAGAAVVIGGCALVLGLMPALSRPGQPR